MKAICALTCIFLLVAVIVLALSNSRQSSQVAAEVRNRVAAEEKLLTVQCELEGLTRDRNPRIRQKSIELIQVYKPGLAKDLCPNLLEDEKDPMVLMALLDLAGNAKVKPAFASVLRHLQSAGDLPVRAKAAWVLGEMAMVLDQEQREKSRTALVEAIASKPPEPVPSKTGRPGIRAELAIGLPLACVEALGKLKDPKSSAALVALLRPETSIIVRRAVVRCLPGIGQKEEMEPLTAAWRNEHDAMLRGDIQMLLGQEPFNLSLAPGKGFIPKPVTQDAQGQPK